MAIHSFDDLIAAITNAVTGAKRLAEEQHLHTLQRFFKQDGDKWVAHTRKVQVPSHEAGDEAFTIVDVPLFTLVPLSSLNLHEVEVEFKAFLSSVDKGEKQQRMQLELTGDGMIGKRRTNITVRVSLKGGDPPEGLVRINDNILKQIP